MIFERSLSWKYEIAKLQTVENRDNITTPAAQLSKLRKYRGKPTSRDLL